ncbi:MAG: DUF885 domain-containing protein [Parvularculaceae bacterium]|nr:DUF885 domain-containing protein [Parvularculaceae bacterium]
MMINASAPGLPRRRPHARKGLAGAGLLLPFSLVLAACSAKEKPPAIDLGAEVRAIADEYQAAILDVYPFAVVYAGAGDVIDEDRAAMEDNSPRALGRLRAVEDRLSPRLAAIDPSTLTVKADWVTWWTLTEAIAAAQGMRVCEAHLWNVNHMAGWQNSFMSVADAQDVETTVGRAQALARWRRLPAFLAQETENLRAGLAAGYSAPKRVVARVIGQLDSIVAAGAEALPYLSFAKGVEDDEKFAAAVAKLGADDMLPAIAAYRDFLRDDYLPAAREDLSIAALPNGKECYEAMLRQYHTAAIGAEATFTRGQATVEANRKAVIEKGGPLTGATEFGEILKRIKAVRENRFSSEKEVIDWTRAMIPVTREKAAPLFASLPAQEMIVEPFADSLKGAGQSSRYEPKPAAEGPATYRIATDEWADQTRGEAEIVAVHEGWPGHHLQIATAASVEGLHPILRLLGSTAYIEGWARYAEMLAEEAGLYATGYGAVSRRAWPARGMVADPGLHAYGWTNEQVKAFVIDSGRFNEQSADVMLDRVAALPGQLTAYDTGGLEIMRLRSEAVRRLGARFDIQDFHARVLENGAVPLAALSAHVEAWIASEEAKVK